MNDINITNLLDFIGFYKFRVKSSFHKFVQRLHEFCVMISMNDISHIQYLKYLNRLNIFFE